MLVHDFEVGDKVVMLPPEHPGHKCSYLAELHEHLLNKVLTVSSIPENQQTKALTVEGETLHLLSSRFEPFEYVFKLGAKIVMRPHGHPGHRLCHPHDHLDNKILTITDQYASQGDRYLCVTDATAPTAMWVSRFQPWAPGLIKDKDNESFAMGENNTSEGESITLECLGHYSPSRFEPAHGEDIYGEDPSAIAAVAAAVAYGSNQTTIPEPGTFMCGNAQTNPCSTMPALETKTEETTMEGTIVTNDLGSNPAISAAAAALAEETEKEYGAAATKVSRAKAEAEINLEALTPSMMVYHRFEHYPAILLEEPEPGFWTIGLKDGSIERDVPSSIITPIKPGVFVRSWASMKSMLVGVAPSNKEEIPEQPNATRVFSLVVGTALLSIGVSTLLFVAGISLLQ
jgi:hypothetical protein